jgi:hypothetical protein
VIAEITITPRLSAQTFITISKADVFIGFVLVGYEVKVIILIEDKK